MKYRSMKYRPMKYRPMRYRPLHRTPHGSGPINPLLLFIVVKHSRQDCSHGSVSRKVPNLTPLMECIPDRNCTIYLIFDARPSFPSLSVSAASSSTLTLAFRFQILLGHHFSAPKSIHTFNGLSVYRVCLQEIN